MKSYDIFYIIPPSWWLLVGKVAVLHILQYGEYILLYRFSNIRDTSSERPDLSKRFHKHIAEASR